MIRRYNFNAPAHHMIIVGDPQSPDHKVFFGGEQLELEESIAVDDRLSLAEDQSGLEQEEPTESDLSVTTARVDEESLSPGRTGSKR